jgi:DNA-binding CsgD family transcriptional regulator
MKRRGFNTADLSYHLEGLPSRTDYLMAASTTLNAALHGDVAGLNQVDPVTRSVELWNDPRQADLEYQMFAGRLLRATMDDHPVIRHYRTRRADPEPCRISDLVSPLHWRSHPFYHEFFRPIGVRHQLVIALRSPSPTLLLGWSVNRAAGDFSDADLRLARALQPTLDLLNRTYSPGRPPSDDEDGREEARQRLRLTRRELDVLTLLADGCSAQQIASLRRISIRTVHKHLEHIYDKLSCHDRLQAANTARRAGLL